ncbi:hypothetical protein M1O52_04630 [Dehalococcoidia bacterium]|nr:hypothetical protein [Dehalococcoidia bacterium]
MSFWVLVLGRSGVVLPQGCPLACGKGKSRAMCIGEEQGMAMVVERKV